MQHQLESLEARRLLSNTGTISGSVFTDLNANGRHEAGEAGIKGATIYLDANNNGKLDKRETSTLSDKRGQYRFTGLAAGTYRVREVGAESVANTAPRSGWFKITLADGQHVARRMFGNAIVAEIPTSIDLADGEAVQDYLATGARNSGLWNQAGITSTAAKDPRPTNKVLLTLTGTTLTPANVNFSDLTRLTGSSATDVLGEFVFGSATNLDATPPPVPVNPPLPTPQAPTPKSVAREDFMLTHHDHSLLSAKAYLLGDKSVTRSQGLYTVIEHWHQYGIEYKREFLRLAKNY